MGLNHQPGQLLCETASISAQPGLRRDGEGRPVSGSARQEARSQRGLGVL